MYKYTYRDVNSYVHLFTFTYNIVTCPPNPPSTHQISPLSSGPNLVAVDSPFTTFLRLVPSDTAAAIAVVSLMEQFNWTRLGLITQQELSFTSVSGWMYRIYLIKRPP